MFNFLETIFIWGLYLGLPLILILYFFDLKEIIICCALIFTGYNIVPLPDEVSFPINSNREPTTMIVGNAGNKKFQLPELCSEFRCGASDKPHSSRPQYKVTNFSSNLAKRKYWKKMLIKHFPDFESRLSLEKRQAINYQKAIKKIKEFKRVSPLLSNYQKLLNAEEKSAIDYFHGTGIYTKFQDPNTPPNIFDTRKTFLKKMENKKMREKFLETYNREYSIE